MLVTQLKELVANMEGRHGDFARMDAVRHVIVMKKLHQMDTEFQVRYSDNKCISLYIICRSTYKTIRLLGNYMK